MEYPTIKEITDNIDPEAWRLVGHFRKARLLREMQIHKWDIRGLPIEIEFKAIPSETKNPDPYTLYLCPGENEDWTHDNRIRACRGIELNLRCSHQDICWCVWTAIKRIRKEEVDARKDEIMEEVFNGTGN